MQYFGRTIHESIRYLESLESLETPCESVGRPINPKKIGNSVRKPKNFLYKEMQRPLVVLQIRSGFYKGVRNP